MSFEKQADKLYEQLKQNWDGKPFAFEAHSWGGLVYWHFVNKYPEMVSHCLLTGSPTISNEDWYPAPLVAALKIGIQHPDIANWIIDHAPTIGPLKGLQLFKDMTPEQRHEAWCIYLCHIGERSQSQWNPLISNGPITAPTFLLYGDHDTIVRKFAGMGAAFDGRGNVIVLNPDGDHDVVGNHDNSFNAHVGMTVERAKREKLIIH